MDEKLAAWIHDDITWCMESDCPETECFRNPQNMAEREGLHSYAMFRGTVECPLTKEDEI